MVTKQGDLFLEAEERKKINLSLNPPENKALLQNFTYTIKMHIRFLTYTTLNIYIPLSHKPVAIFL
jgi:hypothetical protein